MSNWKYLQTAIAAFLYGNSKNLSSPVYRPNLLIHGLVLPIRENNFLSADTSECFPSCHYITFTLFGFPLPICCLVNRSCPKW